MTFKEWFDESEQHYAFNFYANTTTNNDEIIQKILIDYYTHKICLGENIKPEDFKDAENYIKLTWKHWKINKKIKEIEKDFN